MFLKNLVKDTKSIILLAVLSFVLLESLVLIGVTYIKKSDTKNYLSIVSPDFKSHIDIASSHLTDISRIFYDITIDKPKIEDLMFKASSTQNEKLQAKLRQELYQELVPSYEYMKKYNVRQLHFQLPKTVSFLRFHKPSKFGDSLLGVRETLEYVNEFRTPISAFEEGRIFNGFRNVYPIYKDNIFVGTVEISFSFSGMQEILSKIDSTTYIFLIKESIVGSKVFDEEKLNYKKSEFKQFLYDKTTLKDTMQIGLKEVTKINSHIAEKVNKSLKEGKLFSLFYKEKEMYENNTIIISFVPVSNLEDEVVAYIIHYEFGNFIDLIFKNLQALFWLLTLLAFILSSIFTGMIFNEKKKQKLIHDFAIHDSLTGIYNREGINEIINQKIAEAKETNKNFSVIFFDIDFFKRVNDIYGHDMGDYVLENIANIVSSEIKKGDIFARWGGEEFMLFLPNTDMKTAVELANTLRAMIEEHAFSNIDSITCSFGVTILRNNEEKTAFLKRADRLLYKAKESGRNCVKSA